MKPGRRRVQARRCGVAQANGLNRAVELPPRFPVVIHLVAHRWLPGSRQPEGPIASRAKV